MKKLTPRWQACELLGNIHPVTPAGSRNAECGVLPPIRNSRRKLRWRESDVLAFLTNSIGHLEPKPGKGKGKNE
jgi:hypothetical protein